LVRSGRRKLTLQQLKHLKNFISVIYRAQTFFSALKKYFSALDIFFSALITDHLQGVKHAANN